jgi:hypothetical protein
VQCFALDSNSALTQVLPFGGAFFLGASILLAPPTSMPNWIILHRSSNVMHVFVRDSGGE